MKILIPYFMHNNVELQSGIVAGGIERFIKHIWESYSDVVLVPISLEEKGNWRLVLDKVSAAIIQHNPDVYVCNYLTNTLSGKIEEFNIPCVWICHHNVGGFSALNAVKNMHKFSGHIYMVSGYQADNWQNLSLRINKAPLKIEGIIPPSYVEEQHQVSNLDFRYDCATIGRSDPDKHPFLLYDALKDSDLASVIYTNRENENYLNKWLEKIKDPHAVEVNKKHADIMNDLQFAKTFMVTWKHETFGIIALEAMSRGLPVILNCTNDFSHASENIMIYKNSYKKIVNKKQLTEAIEYLSGIYNCIDTRQQLADATHNLFNKTMWMKTLDNVFNKAIEQHNKDGLIFEDD